MVYIKIINTPSTKILDSYKNYNKDKTIFINIPSYADTEIWKTIDSFFSNAKNPDRVFIGGAISTFSLGEEYLRMFKYKQKYGERVNVSLLIPGQIIGSQPARKHIHQYYTGQDYYLNVDCHMRAMKNWDEDLISYLDNLESTKNEKCVLTSNIPAYWEQDGVETYDNFDPSQTISYCLSDSHEQVFKDRGVLQMISHYIKIDEPLASPYISGGFFFTRGEYVEKVKFITKVVFSEEEIFMAMRFFTAGINIYIPTRLFLYHKFDRTETVKRKIIWEDFPDEFYPLHESSRVHCVNALIDNIVDEDENLFGVRTVREYEELFGVDFKNRTVSEDFKAGKFPTSFTISQ